MGVHRRAHLLGRATICHGKLMLGWTPLDVAANSAQFMNCKTLHILLRPRRIKPRAHHLELAIRALGRAPAGVLLLGVGDKELLPWLGVVDVALQMH